MKWGNGKERAAAEGRGNAQVGQMSREGEGGRKIGGAKSVSVKINKSSFSSSNPTPVVTLV